MAPAQGTSNVPLQCQRVKMSLRAELCGPGEGLRRKEGPSEESQSVRKGFSEVGHNRAFENGLLENRVPSIQGDVRKGTEVDRKQQQQRQGLILYQGSLNPVRRSPRSVPAALGSAGDVSMTQAWLLHAGTAI